ncbi:lipoprotein insertase outer membrane protein LolB [Sulfuriferula nivalis]|uniref:Outer-membrane lipoprotein LolB n=1 Tax=Sulfuriferula nivalis TaxID=2675298 RepID=A0A809S027_9PROT|nr:lipoprotein insertase outer membrane protein LolB [Sulfuriferula nivalis]BBO99847.1 outer-membrane lipoprotein LolB [Sulfuriferula nivalis]
MLRVLLLGLLLSVAGCASTPPVVQVQQLNPTAARAFVLDGRIAMHYQTNAASANVHWVHSQAQDEVTLSSPLGSTLAVLTRDEYGVRVVDSEKKVYAGQDVTELTERLLGVRIPLDYLAYWVLGQAVPYAHFETKMDAASMLASLQQAGWTVSYQRWQQAGGYNLPNKLSVTGEGGELRMVITRWYLNGEGV